MNTALILSFLKKLAANNKREWMLAHKDEFEAARAEFYELVQQMIDRLSLIDKSLVGVGYKECVFRIHRDIRFSPDKRPYKEYFSAYIVRGGRKSERAGYYIHIQPDSESLIGGGIHMPTTDLLKYIRKEIAVNGDELTAILENPEYKSVYSDLEGEKLKRAPKEYAITHPYIELLKLKSYDAVYYYRDDEFVKKSEAYMNDMMEKFKVMLPLNQFFNDIFDDFNS
ncbi:MAG: DUF2461 domain-containing protein [Bacteroidales bacterium]|nr:DUF2461 domain-containing protein [Bacteroidales bacterium]